MSVYSTVNVATIARDLTRHPSGRALATDLLHAYAIDEHGLVDLDAVATPSNAGQRRADARTRAEADLIGTVDELVRWVRDDVLGHAWDHADGVAVARHPHALDVVGDGVLGSWVGDDGPLVQPWRGWMSGALPATVREPAVAAVVAMVAAATAADLTAAGDSMGAARVGGWSWPAAMHDACWAIELTGRGRTAAVAQLEAVAALLDVMAQPGPDVIAAVTAAVHATVVADVLPTGAVGAMCRPLLVSLT